MNIVEQTFTYIPESFSILISKEQANYTAEEAARDFSEIRGKAEKAMISGVSAVHISREIDEIVFVIKNNREYRFFGSWDIENAAEESRTFNQILSTFRFIE